jgi:hypothetical protein
MSSSHELKKREIVVDLGGHTLTASQYPTVTTGWWESVRSDGIHTWIAVPFTQTFATTVLDQLGPAQSGRIGLATDQDQTTNAAGEAFTDRIAGTSYDNGVQIDVGFVKEPEVVKSDALIQRYDLWLCSLLNGMLVGHMLGLAINAELGL